LPAYLRTRQFDHDQSMEPTTPKKRELAHRICVELKILTMIEEKALNEAHVEHDGGKMLVNDIEAGGTSDDYYDASTRTFERCTGAALVGIPTAERFDNRGQDAPRSPPRRITGQLKSSSRCSGAIFLAVFTAMA
jgi:hypothetical protein